MNRDWCAITASVTCFIATLIAGKMGTLSLASGQPVAATGYGLMIAIIWIATWMALKRVKNMH